MKNSCLRSGEEKRYSLSFVLPLYNEEKNVARCVCSCLDFARRHCSFHEIILVDDGSADGTYRVCEKLVELYPRLRLIHHPRNLGIGAALCSGFRAARGEYVFCMDGDNQFDVFELKDFLPHLTDYDLILGRRFRRVDAVTRKFNAWLYKAALSAFLGLRFRDIDCGFKLFSRKIIQDWLPKSKGAFFIAEFVHGLKKRGARIKEIPVSHYPRLYGTQTGARAGVILKAFLEMFSYLIKKK